MTKIIYPLLALMLALTFNSCKQKEKEVLMFSFFREPNGKAGLYLATSEDGINWEELNIGHSFLVPSVGKDSLMRDPSICQGPDGTFHMVWTNSWRSQTIGYASSKDLINWSEQQDLKVMSHDSTTLNCWAPEIYYDDATQSFYIVWASSVESNPASPNKDGNNHRMFETHTKDFLTFSPTQRMYCPPNMTVIDACFLKKEGKYWMFIKNEDKGDAKPMKYIYLTSADKFLGNYSYEKSYGEFKISPEWVEGPTAFEWNGEVFCIFDIYSKKQYGAVRSKDMKTWTEQEVKVPKGMRHGTVFKAPASVIENIRKIASEKK